MKSPLQLPVALLIACMLIPAPLPAGEPPAARSVFARDNLVAWCIVPFDAKNRNPQQRAEMLVRLGLRKLAYDWRQQHVPTFEEEIRQMKRHGIEFFAFWGTHPEFTALMHKHGIRPQIWVMMHAPAEGTQEHKVEEAARRLLPLVKNMGELGCKVALYNHGGWAGEPANLTAVAKWLRDNEEADHVGIVYNLHHGHDHMDDFAGVLALMQPYLFCLNLNGMNDGANPKILPIGQGQHDVAMFKAIRESGYAGPIGILDHRGDTDAEEALRANLDGLKEVLEKLGDDAALETYK